MTYGEEHPIESASTVENVTKPGNGGGPSDPTITTHNATTHNATTQEEKKRVFERVEREMGIFRKGECSRFQASTCVTNELGNWAGASDQEKGKALDSYLAEINSILAIQDEDR